MFAIGNAKSSVSSGNDMPVVAVSDAANGMYHFLRKLYYPNDLNKHASLSIEQKLTLLDLACKFMVEFIRQEIVEYLHKRFPSTLAGYYANSREGLMHTTEECVRDIRAGTLYNIPEILPAAYYSLCQVPLDYLVELVCDERSRNEQGSFIVSWTAFLADIITTCARGLPKLLHLRGTVVETYMQEVLCADSGYTYHCRAEVGVAMLAHYNAKSRDGSAYQSKHIFHSDFTVDGLSEKEKMLICDVCRAEWVESEKKGKERAWEQLPGCFGLRPWANGIHDDMEGEIVVD